MPKWRKMFWNIKGIDLQSEARSLYNSIEANWIALEMNLALGV